MALTMENAEFARSQGGTNAIISNLETDCKNLKTALTGKNRDDLIKVFDSYWVGHDHDAFIADLKNKTANISSKVSEMQKIITEGLNNDLKDFKSKQSTFYKK